METPIMIYPSAIEKRVWINRFWSVIITAGIVCIGTYILTDAKFMNKPIIEKWYEATVFEQKGNRRVYHRKQYIIRQGLGSHLSAILRLANASLNLPH